MNHAKLLGTALPIIQAPMAGSQGSALAIAVAKAGGLGSIPCAALGAEEIKKELTAMKASGVTSYNLNFFCHENPSVDDERERAWRALLAPYYEEFGVYPPEAIAGPARMPFDDASARLVEQFRPSVVSFHFGLPERDLFARVKATGAQVLSSATTVAEARWLAARGVDAIIAQGGGAGGHRGTFLPDDQGGQLGATELLRKIVAAVEVPVLAAGGIADRAGVVAALDTGAVAVQVGTAYLLCPEASTGPIHRAALRSPEARRTEITRLFTGRPARGIVNRLMRELGAMNETAPEFPLAAGALAPLRKAAEGRGTGDFSPLWSGVNGFRCREVSALDITRDLAGGGLRL